MAQMRDLLRKVNITPVSSELHYNLMYYYSENITYWDRSVLDTRKVILPNLYTFEKVFPIPSTS